jgi:hypothetical protein
MRTSIFNKFADLPKEFLEDFDILWKLPKEQRNSLIPNVSRIYKAETAGQTKLQRDKAVTEIGGDPTNLLKVLKLLNYIYREWNPIYDTPENFLKDLAELKLIPPDRAEDAKEFLLDFLSEIQRDNVRRLEKMYAISIIPVFEGVTAVVDFRAVVKQPFGTGLEDKIEDYKPKCLSFVPVIIIKISRDSGLPQTFEFQCEEAGIEMLIEFLQAALKDLKAAKSYLQAQTSTGA